MRIYLALIALFATILISLTSCGGDSGGSSLNGNYSVQDVNILANDIRVNESVRTEIFFETKIEDDGSPDNLQLVVRVPAELSYLSFSSEIYDNNDDQSDSRSPDQTIPCPTGETYLVYNLSEVDLFDRELNGVYGNFGLKLQLVGKSPVTSTFVGASAAGVSQDFVCGQFFAAEQNEAVQVLP